MEEKVRHILSQMSLKEKIALCSGKDFWHTKAYPQYGIESVMLCDGPHGLRKQENEADMLGINASVPATCFPTASLTACSWDAELLFEIGRAIGEEAAANGVGVVLGPGANLKRDPLCGRNFEYFSEDPLLSGKLAAGYIRGMQSTGVGASLKHFAANNQEYKRFSSDSVVDERTLRELYLTAFEIAVKEGKPDTVMCSYNLINGVHSSENKWLLTDLLRREWGFRGLVVTDWGAMSDRVEAFRAGCDLNMPGGSAYGERAAQKAVKAKTLSEQEIDACAARVLSLALQKAEICKRKPSFDEKAHHALARRAAESSIVLLKNTGVLPLQSGTSVALIGDMAEHPRYQGAGSSHIRPTGLSCLKDQMPAVYRQGCEKDGTTTEALLSRAAEAAKSAQVAVVVAGLTDEYESEGFDRASMKMPEGHVRMIEAVLKANPDTVVVLCTGGAVETPWADEAAAIVYAGLSGQAGAEAIVNILFGKTDPSGRLAETWAMRYEDHPTHAYYGEGFKDGQYREGLYVGYRYFDKAEVPVRFPFGFGLSYTTFSYAGLNASREGCSVTVTNTGTRAGAEVVQVYLRPPQDGVYRPQRELKAFEKVFLNAGESRTLTFPFSERTFAVWQKGWVVPRGEYAVCVGGLETSVFVEGETLPVPEWQKASWYERPHGAPSSKEWEELLGRAYSEKVPRKGKFTMENSVSEMKEHSLVMKLMYRAVERVIVKGTGGKREGQQYKMMMAGSTECSLSSMQINGGMKDGIMQGLLEMANGHFFRGILRMIKGG